MSASFLLGLHDMKHVITLSLLLIFAPDLFAGTTDKYRELLDRQVGHLTIRYEDGQANGYTAFLVAPCYVMTAVHDMRTDMLRGNKAKSLFELGFRGSERKDAFQYSSAATLVAAGEFKVNFFYEEEDWALFRLERCLGKKFGYLPLMSREFFYQNNWGDKSFTVFAYYYVDGRFKLNVQNNCIDSRLFFRVPAIFETECSVFAGNSGSPLVYIDDGTGQVYAAGILNSAKRRDSRTGAYSHALYFLPRQETLDQLWQHIGLIEDGEAKNTP